MCGRDNKRSGSCRQSLDSSFDMFNFIDLSASPSCVRNSAGRFVCVNKKFISYFNSNIDCIGLTIDAVTGLGFDEKITLSSLELSCNSMIGITCISHDLVIMSRLWDVRIELFSFKDEVFYFWHFSPAYYSVFSAVNNNVPFHVGTNEVFIETLLTPREKEVFFMCYLWFFKTFCIEKTMRFE